ncbi:MAG: hypothetical protein SPK50_03230 [Mobiluncus porci]|uniref:hypothetical protein n=1 Tax=Mobiluncus porci TaxID=2652278 RepID=UPI0023F493F3|nr:hypothetical protein [Mobiluncus porci]MDD7541286.1 hypothetical protein [Mobiluncus porci]MDY5748129.1 hypothetical protein [Mobiluncus porci]
MSKKADELMTISGDNLTPEERAPALDESLDESTAAPATAPAAPAAAPTAAPAQKKPRKPVRLPSLPERIFGAFLVIAAVVVLVTATTQWISDTTRIRNQATVKVIKTVAPLDKGWQLDLPKEMKDPRSIQVWDYQDSQNSLAAQDNATGATAKLTETQNLVLVKGTDGKKETQAIALIDTATGQAVWSKTYNDLPLDYCLDQLWTSSIVCESGAAKKVVRIDPTGNVAVGDLPNGIWDLATGSHHIGSVYDQFLVVPIAVAQGASAGVDAQYINPDFSYRAHYQILVPNAAAAEPISTQSRGSTVLVGVVTSGANGENLKHTWGWAQTLNTVTGTINTSNLGSQSQVSMLEAGFFGSSNPEDTASDQADWAVYNPDASVAAQGKAPRVAVQAMHAQLRSGLVLDATAATAAMQSGKVPVIMPDKTYFVGSAGETCSTWPGCAAREWTTGDGAAIRLKDIGSPLTSDGKTAVFSAGGGLLAYGVVDGKFLWEGITPPLEGAAVTGDPQPLGAGIAQLAQVGEVKNAKAVLAYWNLP